MNSFAPFKNFRAPSDMADVPELDVTPIMNMFIILIPFLVSMAVFTHLAIIEFSLPPNVGTSLNDSTGKPKLKITVVVAEDYLALTQGENLLDSIGMIDGEYDRALFKERLVARRAEAEITNELIVAVRDRIHFKHVVKVMDICRESGFEKIGLSSATENPLEMQ